MSFSPRFRNAVPLGLRRALRLAQRFATDLVSGEALRAPAARDLSGWTAVATVRQALTSTPNADAKRHNIGLAAKAFSARPLSPNGTFSFWGWLGAPSRARGYLPGRALRNGRLALETGGGLCQLAGALYFAGLQAGLRAEERHAHSTDLYTDETRYAPLGSDATVSYGFKDLRLRNPHGCAVAFDISTGTDVLDVRVMAERPLRAVVPDFRRIPLPDGSVAVETWVEGRMTARTVYKPFSA